MSRWAVSTVGELEPDDRSSQMRHVRYREGEVGETARSVHGALLTQDGLLTSACGQKFDPARMEEATGGMPCVACIQHATLAAQGQTPSRAVGEHGETARGELPE